MKKWLRMELAGVLASIGASTGLAATGTSAEFKVDLRGMEPWETRTAAASEAIAGSFIMGGRNTDYPCARKKGAAE